MSAAANESVRPGIDAAPGPTAALDDQPVTLVVTRTARAGQERAYEAWLADVAHVAQKFPGHLGVNVIRPTSPASREYTLVYRFDCVANLRRWDESVERAQLLARVAPLYEGDTSVQKLSGMESWFALPGRAVQPPPRHKMAVVSWIAAFPLVQLLNAFVAPRLGFLPPIARGVVVSVAMILAMTYVVMPRLTRLFAGWLYPRR